MPPVRTQPLLDEHAWLRAGEDEDLRERDEFADLHDDHLDEVWSERRWRRRAVKALGWAGVLVSVFATFQIGAASPRAREEIGRWATLDVGQAFSDAKEVERPAAPAPREVPQRTPVTQR